MVILAYAALLASSVASSVAPPAPVTPVLPPMPRPEQIMALPPALRTQFQAQVIDAGGSQRARLERLAGFLFKKTGLGMEYAVDATYTVEQAFRTRKANCLTFTLLTVALAREAGLEAYGQELLDVVSWRAEQDVVYGFNHVNAGILIGQSHYTIDVARDVLTARSPPQRISDQHLLALYYNNRAAELLVGDPPAVADPYMAMALQLAPNYPSAWANAGVLNSRKGDRAAAERDYLKALTLDPDNASALANLVTLYRSSGDEAKRATYEKRLEKVQAKDPYFEYVQAEGDEKKGDYAGAVRHYRRAIRLYDKEPRFFTGLARAYQQLGEQRQAERALNHAATLGSSTAGN
jgi:tetratricopeptide (TPR) repeat protein